MSTVVTAPGKIEVWRGRTRVYAGTPSAELLAAFAALVDAKADRSGTFTVRLTTYPTFGYTVPAPPVWVLGAAVGKGTAAATASVKRPVAGAAVGRATATGSAAVAPPVVGSIDGEVELPS